jgi:hypothetical protein
MPVPCAFCRRTIEDESIIVAVYISKIVRVVVIKEIGVVIVVLEKRVSVISVATFIGILSSPRSAKYAVVWKK